MPGLIVQGWLCLGQMALQWRKSGCEKIAGSDAAPGQEALVDAIQVRRQSHCCHRLRLTAREDDPSACQLAVVGTQVDSNRRTPPPDGHR
jgi:hypothetical protein